MESAALYSTKGEVPEGEFLVPFGKADVKLQGTDVTVVAVSRLVREAIAAAEVLSSEGISIEVIDPRTLVPLDMETIVSSVKKTGRLVTAEDGVKTSGVGAEIISRTMEMAIGHIEDLQRVGCPDVPAPFSPPLQDAYMPGKKSIVETVKKMMADLDGIVIELVERPLDARPTGSVHILRTRIKSYTHTLRNSNNMKSNWVAWKFSNEIVGLTRAPVERASNR